MDMYRQINESTNNVSRTSSRKTKLSPERSDTNETPQIKKPKVVASRNLHMKKSSKAAQSYQVLPGFKSLVTETKTTLKKNGPLEPKPKAKIVVKKKKFI